MGAGAGLEDAVGVSVLPGSKARSGAPFDVLPMVDSPSGRSTAATRLALDRELPWLPAVVAAETVSCWR